MAAILGKRALGELARTAGADLSWATGVPVAGGGVSP